ncbi:baseplate multidomain protein megatron [Enterovirga rhinocerotis]|uniref:Putative tail protein n=1 Tax=Enterovirga rhinocerotis TaxID=1339210 RepID=A0A4R7BWB8_9HYPH|nr:glycoside hydrolase/phage tail family protein [Enterovirga rhinocerotis]TDR88965.1 putative tail protein [Enterovirga rhinocerotis]
MTTLVLQAADKVIGGVAGAATTFLGRAVSGLFAEGAGKDTIRFAEGPRLAEMSGLTSQEGAPIPRLYGRARLGGQLIWATRFEEVVNTSVTVERQSGRRGGKSLGGTPRQTNVTTTYSYVANLAIGLCEGPIGFVRRVWADGKEVDLTTLAMRVHRGAEDQEPDPLIVAKEGAADAPAYRGLAYVVFERLPLAPYGNRVPQFSFEVVRPVGTLAPAIRSVCLIPGATEFGYDTLPVTRTLGLGRSLPENSHQLGRRTDVEASLDGLEALCPNLTSVSLVASWFGTDLRVGECRIEPRVDLKAKATLGGEWRVSGLTRFTAAETSRAGGSAAYGGTPSDASVIRLIQDLKARGLAVTLYPFVMMDVPADNALPDPWSGEEGQAPYPWRGRITCHPAPGRAGSPDGTEAAADQVASFFGEAGPGDVQIAGGAVTYSGPAEWSFRRLVLHYAKLAVAAGGVDAFVIGSELVGLTRVRSGPGAYPAVAALRALAADVRSILGPSTKIVYAADWTEYGAHVRDGGAEVRFPLDPLFADTAIDAVGIDYYPPISDWREGAAHLDAGLSRGSSDLAYLRDRLGAGEAFDWYYAGTADRELQVRTPITDGAYGKPWTFRAKDLVGWWSNAHVERVGGVETGATAWQPRSKPIWLTEIGIPAVDKGPNGPNVFPDPKSSESALPPFSTGARDDLVQARGLEAILSRFDHDLPGHEPAMNPLSDRYDGRMVDRDRVSVWCWDARPYPAFPDFDDVWADGANWTGGHWVTGRLEGAPLDRVVAAILADYGLDPSVTEGLDGFLDGYVVDRPMSARQALEPLASLYGFDAVAGAAGIAWRGRGAAQPTVLAAGDLVDPARGPVLARSRAQESDLPVSIELGFTDAEGDYARAAAGSRRLAGTSRRELAVDAALIVPRAEAQRLAEIRLQDSWTSRETVEFELSPRDLGYEPGDVLSLDDDAGLYRIERIVDGPSRRVLARAVEPAVFVAAPVASRTPRRRRPPSSSGQPHAVVLDLPASGSQPEVLQHLAVAADPWPGAVAIYRDAGAGSHALHGIAETPAIIGRTLAPFGAGPVWRWDVTGTLEVEVSSGSLSSVSDEAALAGASLLAVIGPDGAAEIVSARDADLVGLRHYRLSRLLRGLGGTEHLAARTLAAGATVVVLDGSLAPLSTSLAELGQSFAYRIGPAGRDQADPTYASLSAPVTSAALLPLAPVGLKARREPGGIRLSWIRRTRLDGDGWSLAEVPLAEESEAYEVEVLSAGSPVRLIEAPAASCLYPAAAELADFGAARATLSVRIFQISRTVGRGRAAAAVLPIL